MQKSNKHKSNLGITFDNSLQIKTNNMAAEFTDANFQKEVEFSENPSEFLTGLIHHLGPS